MVFSSRSLCPLKKTNAVGHVIAAILVIFLCATFMYSVLKNKGGSKLALKGYKFYCFIYIGVPLISALLWLFYVPALTRGIPNVVTSVVGITEERTVTVLKTRVWGKNDNRFILWLSGFTEGVRASRYIYGEFPSGSRVKITIKTSMLGTKVLTYSHVEI